jgi:hypothetical protein
LHVKNFRDKNDEILLGYVTWAPTLQTSLKATRRVRPLKGKYMAYNKHIKSLKTSIKNDRPRVTKNLERKFQSNLKDNWIKSNPP